MRYFVHIYHVVRSKMLVDAPDHKTAMQLADTGLTKANERLNYMMLSSLEEEQKVASLFDVAHMPIHLQTESAEEFSGYLIDEVGDDEYDRTVSYDANGEQTPGNPKPSFMCVSDAERDTILAALRYWQRTVASKEYGPSTLPEWDIACNGEDMPIDAEAIDTLCERINN